MKRGESGTWEASIAGGENVRAFLPHPLPPAPPLEFSSALREKWDTAHLTLGRLDSVTTLLPNAHLFLYSYVRKEAVLSSQIEGTQSSLADLMLYENDAAPGVPLDDVEEVSCYVRALNFGLGRVREGWPVSYPFVLELHRELLSSGRGAKYSPGEFRRTQNWVGGAKASEATYIPPPPQRVADCWSDLEKFWNDVPTRHAPLLKAALAHVQFETIHPFLDGNGRLGRLLIALTLVRENLLAEPLLYLSLYLKAHRARYYELLQSVRENGDWEEWLEFFADAVISTGAESVQTARALNDLIAEDASRLRTIGRAAGSALRVQQALARRPLSSAGDLKIETGLSLPTVHSALRTLENAAIVQELTGGQRGQLFVYREYLNILNR